jgi:hypothetical protein
LEVEDREFKGFYRRKLSSLMCAVRQDSLLLFIKIAAALPRYARAVKQGATGQSPRSWKGEFSVFDQGKFVFFLIINKHGYISIQEYFPRSQQ